MPQRFETFGSVTIASAISDLTITASGAAAAIDPTEVRNGLGMAQVDQWADGMTQKKRIDGVEVMVRRSGWRIELWGAEEEAPSPAPLPAPQDAHDFNQPQAPVRLKIAPGYFEPQVTKVPSEAPPPPPPPSEAPPPPPPPSEAPPSPPSLRALARTVVRVFLRYLLDRVR